MSARDCRAEFLALLFDTTPNFCARDLQGTANTVERRASEMTRLTETELWRRYDDDERRLTAPVSDANP